MRAFLYDEHPPASVNATLILGGGYTGQTLGTLLANDGLPAISTSRRPDLRSAASHGQWVRFDLSDESTWATLPEAPGCVWTFPAEPVELVRSFSDTIFRRCKRVVVIGTTSSYRPTGGEAELDETAVLDASSPRVQGEELLRGRGAIVLRSAGMYGPAVGELGKRNPLDWLRRALIGSPDRTVNLIHVEDLAIASMAALRSDLVGEQFIVTDGTPRRWGDIAAWARQRGYVGDVRYSGAGTAGSKRLSNALIRERLKPQFRHTDLYAELRRLEES